MGVTGLLAVGTAVSIGSSVYGSQQQADAQKKQADFEKWQGEANARLSDLKAEDAITRGDRKAKEVKLETSQTIGRQRANFAGQGIEVNKGTTLDVQADTAASGALDKKTVENNAWREAWGFRVEAAENRAASAYGVEALERSARNTVLTGGLDALNAGLKGAYLYKKGG